MKSEKTVKLASLEIYILFASANRKELFTSHFSLLTFKKIKQLISRVLFLNNHLSGIGITPNLKRFFREGGQPVSRFNLAFDRGLPSRYFSISLVKLLTHRCTIACGFMPIGSIFPVVLSTGSRRPEFLRLTVLECTDFPHPKGRDCSIALFGSILA